MSVHKEIAFENDICAHLAAHGWFYAAGDAATTSQMTCAAGHRPIKPYHWGN